MFQVADIALTRCLIGLGKAYEANPVVSSTVAAIGWEGVLYIKIILSIALYFGILITKRDLILIFVTAAYGLLNIYQVWMIAN